MSGFGEARVAQPGVRRLASEVPFLQRAFTPTGAASTLASRPECFAVPTHDPDAILPTVAVCVKCRSVVNEQGSFCPHCGTRLPAQPPPSDLSHGAEARVGDFGKVVLGQVIGQGGMGLVRHGWLYYDPHGPQAGHPPHPVAVKILHPYLTGKQRARFLFAREATALERLRHPNIVHFFGMVDNELVDRRGVMVHPGRDRPAGNRGAR